MCLPNLHFLCIVREKRDSTFNRFLAVRVNGGRRTASDTITSQALRLKGLNGLAK